MAKETTTKKPVERVIHEIDAEGKASGRLATQIAKLLIGKHKPTYEPRLDGGDRVVVLNVEKMSFSGKKIDQKVYYHHSGYPGGLKTRKIKDVYEKTPELVLKRAVWNMLPKNKLRNEMIKRLKFGN